MNSARRGCLQVYTGNGKGKTTAALGLAVRAIGHGHKVFMLMFMKGCKNYGELAAAGNLLPGLTIEQYGLESFVNKDSPSPGDLAEAGKAFSRALEVVAGGEYQLVILDEINVALDYGLVDLDGVLKLIESRPPRMELVFTGRYAHPEVIGAADLVTEMTLVKHPFYQGLEARQGIEY